MSFERPSLPEETGEEQIGEEKIELSDSLEAPESANVEKGDSFLQRTASRLKEGVKTFFSVPEEGKIMNIMEKVGGTAYMGLWAKVAMDQRFNDLVATSSEQEKLAFAALAIGAMGVVPIMHALEKQYRERKERKHV